MHKKLLVAFPFLFLTACTIKSDDDVDADDGTDATEGQGSATEGQSSATEGNSSVTAASGIGATEPSATEASATEASASATEAEVTTTPGDPTETSPDDPASDNCVPQDPQPGTTSTSGDPSGGEETSAGDGGSTAGPDTAGDTETDGEEPGGTGGQECELPQEHPSPVDFDCTCNVPGEHRSCTGADAQPGTRFCDGENWGPCVAEPECLPGTYNVCFACDSEFGTGVAWCLLQGGVPHFDEESDECNTPLVLSFDGRRVEYTSAHAEFAMTSTDVCGARDWPTAATPWLAIDLDRNGNIDGGHELFGNGTRIGGVAPPTNGFIALAAFDSNKDGQISAADERFDELVLWGDDDADRRSTLWELAPIASRGIVSIDLEYATPASQCDARGNCEVERARFVFEDERGARSSGEIVDIRLTCQ